MQQLASGLYIPDGNDPPDLKALYDPNWQLLDGVIPDGVSKPWGSMLYSAASAGVSKRAAPVDHQHPMMAPFPGAGAIGNFTETRQTLNNPPAGVDTVLYTAPADVNAVVVPLIYVQNGAAASTVTVKVNGLVIRALAVGASASGTIVVPPLTAGDVITVNPSVQGPTYFYTTPYEIRDPSWKVLKTTNQAAGVGVAVYTVPSGIRGARGIYIPNILTPTSVVALNATTFYVQLKPLGGTAINAFNVSVPAAATTQVNPAIVYLSPTDVVLFYSTVAGAYGWLLVQEF